MICTYCGKETSDDSVYCEHCGNYLANNIYDGQNVNYQQSIQPTYNEQNVQPVYNAQNFQQPYNSQINQPMYNVQNYQSPYNSYSGNNDSSIKTIAILSYITWICIIIAMCSDNKNNAFLRHHCNNALLITLCSFGLSLIACLFMFVYAPIAYLIFLANLVLTIICIIFGAIAAGEMRYIEFPLLSKIKIIS